MSQVTVSESEGFGMNTEISCRVYGPNAQEAAACAMAEMNRLENLLSRFLPGSEVSRLNEFSGKGPVKISSELFKVLSNAIQYSEISQGAFDISVGPLIDLWDYKHALRVPEKARIRQALSLVDYHDLVLKECEQTVELRKPGQSIDLGGIGKGFAGDRCMEILQKKGITSAFINIGGNVSLLGNRPDGALWRVGIRHPRNNGSLLGVLETAGKAVVTSGDYERFFIDHEGKRRHHILNPATGYPADSGLISVTVAADSAMTADAMSTAIFAAGMDKGLKYLLRFSGAEAVLVDKYQRVYITQGLEWSFRCAGGIEAKVI